MRNKVPATRYFNSDWFGSVKATKENHIR